MRDYTKICILDIIHDEINYYHSQGRFINSITLGKRDFIALLSKAHAATFNLENRIGGSLIYNGYTIKCAKKAINLIRVNIMRQAHFMIRPKFSNFVKNPLTCQQKIINLITV